jgi:hypothetical protein
MSVFATKANQESAASTSVAISPATQQSHPSACKFWVKATANSTTIVASYNMTSWADTNTGQATGTIATDFSSEHWCGQCSAMDAATAWDATYTTGMGFQAVAAGTFRIDCSRMTDGGTAAAAFYDCDYWYVAGYGDQ